MQVTIQYAKKPQNPWGKVYMVGSCVLAGG